MQPCAALKLFHLGRMYAGIVNAEKDELWIDQREEVGVSGELDTPLEEGTLGGRGRRQANVAADGRGGRALPAAVSKQRGARAAASSGNAGDGAAAVNIKAAGRFKRPVDAAAAAAAAKGDNISRASAKGGSLIRDPEEDDDLALPALKKPSTHPMPLLGTVCTPLLALLVFLVLLYSTVYPQRSKSNLKSRHVYQIAEEWL